MPKRVVFREKALQQYMQQREKTVLPLWVTPPIFLFLWLLLGLLISAGSVAWFTEVPVTTSGVGIIRTNEQQNTPPTVIISLLTSNPIPLQKSTPVRFRLPWNGEMVNAHISGVSSGIVSPGDARKHFFLEDDPCKLSQGPAVVLTAQLDIPLTNIVNGSCGSAQVQIGSRRLLSLLLGVDW